MKLIMSMKGLAAALIALAIISGVALAQNVSNYMEQGGARWVIGGSLDVASGGDLDLESGSTFKIAGTTVSASAAELDQYYLTVRLDNIETASDTSYIPIPAVGDITNIQVAVQEALVSGSVPVFVAYIGTTNITHPALTVTSPVAAGEVGSAVPTAANTVAVGDVFKIESDGGPTTSSPATVTVTIAR